MAYSGRLNEETDLAVFSNNGRSGDSQFLLYQKGEKSSAHSEWEERCLKLLKNVFVFNKGFFISEGRNSVVFVKLNTKN